MLEKVKLVVWHDDVENKVCYRLDIPLGKLLDLDESEFGTRLKEANESSKISDKLTALSLIVEKIEESNNA